MLNHNAHKVSISERPPFSLSDTIKHYQHIGTRWPNNKFPKRLAEFNWDQTFPQVFNTILDNMSQQERKLFKSKLDMEVKFTKLTAQQVHDLLHKKLPNVTPEIKGEEKMTWVNLACILRQLIRVYYKSNQKFQFEKSTRNGKGGSARRRAEKVKSWIRHMFLLKWFTLEEYEYIKKQVKKEDDDDSEIKVCRLFFFTRLLWTCLNRLFGKLTIIKWYQLDVLNSNSFNSYLSSRGVLCCFLATRFRMYSSPVGSLNLIISCF